MANGPQHGTLYDSDRRDGEHNEHGFWDVGKEHVVSVYDDGYHYSHDNNDSNGHWTNDQTEKGDSDRHDPPSDARK